MVGCLYYNALKLSPICLCSAIRKKPPGAAWSSKTKGRSVIDDDVSQEEFDLDVVSSSDEEEHTSSNNWYDPNTFAPYEMLIF